MNKIIQINLAGQAVAIDEQAYEILKAYLGKLYKHFDNTESGEEIINDIESRLSELFYNNIKGNHTFINEADVNEAISLMGSPEDIELEEEEEQKTNEQRTNTESKGSSDSHSKKLFRDPDDQVLGGVCSGLAAYFNIDVSVVRILTVLVVLFGVGFPIPVYLILWAVMPEAKNTHDKFRMHGETPNIDEIADKIRNEAKHVADNLKKNSNLNSAVKGVGSIIENIVRAFSKLFGASVLTVLVVAAILVSIALLANATGNANLHFNDQSFSAPHLFNSPALNWIFNVSLLSIILIPIGTLGFAILQFIFNLANAINLKAVFVAWLISLAIFIGVSIYGSRNINFDEIRDFKDQIEEINSV
ncbi:MAG: PspC domain-containing protein [Bacteroidia bacterium]|nr:PspC domain-containing protein [Bacteroidia bacterium]